MSTSNKRNKAKEERERKERSIAEITVLAMCTALLLFILGYSLYHALTTSGTPPTLSAVPLFDKVTKQGSGFTLPIEIRNETKPTAEDIRIVVKVTKDGEQVEDKQLTVEYLPEHSKMEVYVLLSSKPTRQNVSVEIESYRLP